MRFLDDVTLATIVAALDDLNNAAQIMVGLDALPHWDDVGAAEAQAGITRRLNAARERLAQIIAQNGDAPNNPITTEYRLWQRDTHHMPAGWDGDAWAFATAISVGDYPTALDVLKHLRDERPGDDFRLQRVTTEELPIPTQRKT